MEKLIEILSWDSDFFGIKVAKTNLTDNISEKIDEVMNFIFENNASLVYHFQNPLNKNDVFCLHKNGFIITDEKVILKSKIIKNYTRKINNISAVDFSKDTDNIDELYNINDLTSDISRYAYDEKISADKIKQLYRLWIYNGINNDFCDKTIVYKFENKIVGFIMLKFKGKDANISLIGVNSEYRRLGIGSKLIDRALEYLSDNDFENIYVETQFRNVKALNLYISNGFIIDNTLLIYHKWM